MFKYFSTFLVVLLTGFSVEAKTYTFTDRQGRSLEAEILQIESERIYIKRTQAGDSIWLDRKLLSDKDQAALDTMLEQDKTLYQAINKLLEIELFSDNSLWDDLPGDTAKRLKWPQESKTETQSSFRAYPKANYQVLGAHPFSCVLYGQANKVSSLSLVFANKGDFKYEGDIATKEELKAMSALIEKDSTTIVNRLTAKWGEAERSTFGGSSGLREKIARWDWKGHAFLLSVQDGEYVNLRIIPSEVADRKGKPERISDNELRARNKANIQSRANGDVILKNIPMVNQGPKGYCVPATFERCLRFMDIPADMYLLAMAGQTSAGGGTYVSDLIESLKGYVSRQNRKVKDISNFEQMKIGTVAKYINQGTPIIWTMFSNQGYNTLTNELTKERKSVSNWKQWKANIKTKYEQANGLGANEGAHVCLIIGYNKETGEVATSDSWGPRFEERWILLEGAQDVTYGNAHYIAY